MIPSDHSLRPPVCNFCCHQALVQAKAALTQRSKEQKEGLADGP